MSKTGGGVGTNQHQIKGTSQAKGKATTCTASVDDIDNFEEIDWEKFTGHDVHNPIPIAESGGVGAVLDGLAADLHEIATFSGPTRPSDEWLAEYGLTSDQVQDNPQLLQRAYMVDWLQSAANPNGEVVPGRIPNADVYNDGRGNYTVHCYWEYLDAQINTRTGTMSCMHRDPECCDNPECYGILTISQLTKEARKALVDAIENSPFIKVSEYETDWDLVAKEQRWARDDIVEHSWEQYRYDALERGAWR